MSDLVVRQAHHEVFLSAITTLPVEKLVAELRARDGALGFDSFGIAAADARPDLPAKLNAAIDAGWHGEMDWMAETAERRGSPQALWPEARSVILLGINYGPESDPLAILEERSLGSISVYARNRDYHEIIKGKLKELAGLLAQRSGAEVKVFVDTAPLMEKPLGRGGGTGLAGQAYRAGEPGLRLVAVPGGHPDGRRRCPPTAPHAQSCGSCSRCLDVCPTKAFPAPFQLDSRRCLAYLSVEHKGPIPLEFRIAMGNRIYGCDDCLAVCPWNKFASVSREARLRGRAELERPAAGRAGGAGRRRVSGAVRRLAGQAHRACAVPAQCADRHRQQRRPGAGGGGRGAAGRRQRAGARGGRMGAAATSAGSCGRAEACLSWQGKR